jgi:hypothetical protein
MKRSRQIRLLLLGGLSAGALTGCNSRPSISVADVYTNDFYVAGAGYYHAPFRGWYTKPYNSYDSQNQMYFYGGQWSRTPCESITNVSSPTAEAVTVAEATRTDISRGGFGGSYGGYGGGSGGYYGGGGGGWHFGGWGIGS